MTDMTQRTQPSLSPTPSLTAPTARPRARWPHAGVAALLALMLTACASTPLPPWPSTAPAPRPNAPAPLPRTQPAAVVPPPLGAGAPRTGVVTTPLPPQPAVIARDDPSSALPYGAAVADRFPDPSVRYDTPGLAPERRAFTTNSELADWLHHLADAPTRAPTRPTVMELGMSQRGEPILGLMLTRTKSTNPAALEASGRPTVLLVGQQHGDEPAGAEALLVVARELAQGLLDPLLDKVNVIVVPRANPDGADLGKRSTASGIDMNRDHLLLQTPEAQALARLVRDYRPLVVVDAHEYTAVGRYLQKFQAIQRYDALLQYATTANYPEFLTKASQEWFHEPMAKALQSQTLTSEWYYTNASRPDDLSLSMGGTQPDTGRNVNGLKNTVSLLIETRGVGLGRHHIQRRVHSQVTAITSALRNAAERAGNLEQVRSFVARDTAAQACKGQIVVEAAATPTRKEVLMLDPVTGADKPIAVDWNSSLQLRPIKTRARPCGYWLAPGSTPAVQRLQQLGVQVLRVAEPGSVLGETYQETQRETGARQDVLGTIAGNREIVRAQVNTTRSAVDVPGGSYYVPLSQPLAHLAVAALEPDTQNSYFANRVLEEVGQTVRVMSPPSLVFEDTE